MGFERFEDTGSMEASSEPRISLRKSGSIGISKAAMNEWFEDADAVVLHYDEDNDRIGLEPVEAGEDHSYTITESEGGGSVTPSAFMNRYDLVPEVTTRYAAEWDDDNELVVADLSESVGTYGSADDE
ncbi:hypothetical protein [Natrinema sp. H-ect4]|uniref:hypothetical protein n=1 Tax=Natrinema sp. H-ect4 TaxID=3242699 RepID=UPI0035A87CC3